jgi:hypothetical protein
MEYQATLRIVLLNPPNGVLYCLEDDNERFVSATMSTGDDIVFEFQTVVKPNQRTKKPNITAPFARGTPSKRFFYINIGQSAGQSMLSRQQEKSLGRWCMKPLLILAKC